MSDQNHTAELSQILKERAELLAKPIIETKLDSVDSLLIFSVKEEKYGIHTKDINRVITHKKITPLPYQPDIFLGVLYHNGLLWPVMSASSFFQNKISFDFSHIILLSTDKKRIALAVDSIIGKEPLSETEITNPLITDETKPQSVIESVFRNEVALINCEKLFLLIDKIEIKNFKGE